MHIFRGIMNNITKLAKLLTADFFVWEQNKQTNELKCQNIDNILNGQIARNNLNEFNDVN